MPIPIALEQEIQNAVLLRVLHVGKPKVVVCPTAMKESDLTAKGTVTLVLGHPDSPLFDEIVAAAEKHDATSLRKISDIVLGRFTRYATKQRYKGLAQVPCLTEFRYGGKRLVTSMFAPPELGVSAASVIYNGGALDHGKFEVAHFGHDGGRHPKALVLVSAPRLSALEKEVLQRVPASMSEVNIDGLGNAAWTDAVLKVTAKVGKVVLEAVAAWVVTKVIDKVVDKKADVAVQTEADDATMQNDAEFVFAERQQEAQDQPMIMAEAQDQAQQQADQADQADQAQDVGAEDQAQEDNAGQGQQDQGGGALGKWIDQIENLSQAELSRFDATQSAQALLLIRAATLAQRWR